MNLGVGLQLDNNLVEPLFQLNSDGKAIVFIVSKRTEYSFTCNIETYLAGFSKLIDTLHLEGWSTSIGEMLGDKEIPSLYETGFAHDSDFVATFEAPSLEFAHKGVERFRNAGWEEIFTTNWLIGERDFQPILSTTGRHGESQWGFFALWSWNDEWQIATEVERSKYDEECDVAFRADLAMGLSIAGRHRLGVGTPWDHLGVWEVPAFELISQGMQEHERVADFKFTTSRHLIGLKRHFNDYFKEIS
jgi:hypothetical protein